MSEVARDRLFLLVLAIAAWQSVSMWTGADALPAPVATLRHAAGMLVSGTFWREAAETMRVLMLSTALAAGLGLLFGLWLGTRPFAGAVAEPILVAIAALPKVTLYPVILLIFGLTLNAKVVFAALHGVVPIALFTIAGLRATPRVFRQVGRAMKLGTVDIVRHILLPAALPEIVSGLRIGISLTLLGTLVAEMFAARSGLGFLLVQAIPRLDNQAILALTAIVFGAALMLNVALMQLEAWLRAGAVAR